MKRIIILMTAMLFWCSGILMAQGFDLLFEQAYHDGGTAATSALDAAADVDYEVADNFFGLDQAIEEVVFYGLTLKFVEGVGWQEQVPAATEPFNVRFYEFVFDAIPGLEAPTTGTYEVALLDSYGDGWGGDWPDPAGQYHTLSVFVNGVVVLDEITLLDGTGPEYHTFFANAGDDISTVFTVDGFYANECYYAIIDPDDNIIAEDGGTWANPGASTPSGIGGEGDMAMEPDWANPLDVQNVVFDVEHVGAIWNDAYQLYKFTATLNNSFLPTDGEGWMSVQIDAANGSGTWFLWLNSLEGDGLAWQRTEPAKHPVIRGMDHPSHITAKGETGLVRAQLDYDMAFELYGGEPPTCATPTGLVVTETSLNGAGFAWNPGGAEDMWNIEVGLAGFTPGAGEEVVGEIRIQDDPVWSTDALAQGTVYDVYVQADCGAGDFSGWRGPVSFFTLGPPVLLSAEQEGLEVILNWQEFSPSKDRTATFQDMQMISAHAQQAEERRPGTSIVPLSREDDVEGSSCDNPIIIPGLPFTDVNTTCGMGNNYTETCLGNYDGGEDIVYQLVITETTAVEIILTTATTWTGLLITEECPIGMDCVAFVTGSSGNKELATTLEPGTYYIMISTWPAPDCIPEFTLEVIAIEPCVECPPDAIIEAEPCGEDWNGGCNMEDEFAFDPIEIDDVICGTAWADDGSRDTDWYELVLDTPTSIQWSATGDFPIVVIIVDGNHGCDGLQVITSATAPRCETAVATADLPPGTYWLFVAPSVFEGYPCNGLNTYVAELTGEETFMSYFNVFRNGDLIEEVYALTYADADLVDGETYCYTVSQVLEPGVETNLSNEMCVTINLCVPPTDLAIEILSASSAELSWLTGGLEEQWEVALVDAGDPEPGSGTIVDENSFVFTGLAIGNSYDAYVRAVCDEGSTSDWAFTNFVIDYCDAGPTSSADSDLFRVQIFGPDLDFDNDVGCTGALGVQDFTGLGAIPLQQGVQYTMVLTMGQCGGGTWANVGKAWIDWNNDLDFDEPGERLGVVQGPTSSGGVEYSFSFTIPAGANLGETRLRVVQRETSNPDLVLPCGTFTWGSAHDYTVEILEAPDCVAPSDLIASNVTTTSADLGWTPIGTETQWNIEWGLEGFTPGEGNFVEMVDNPHTITGLTAATSYDFYVQSICEDDEVSAWAGPHTFATECDVFEVFPVIEGFEDDFPPLCWTVVNGAAGSYWEQSSVAVNTGNFSARSYQGFASENLADEWLITPPLDLDQVDDPSLTFFGYSSQAPDGVRENMRILIMDEVYENVEDLHANATLLEVVPFTQTWEEYLISLADFSGVKYLAFNYYITPEDNATFNWIYIDDVRIGEVSIVELTMEEPEGDGTVTPAPGVYEYTIDTQVSLIATPDPGWAFSHWTGDVDDPESASTFIVMDGDKTVQAHFTVFDGFDLPWTENFTGVPVGEIPANWTRDHGNWSVQNTSLAGGQAPEMRFNWSPAFVGESYLTSPKINTSGHDALLFSFKNFLNNFGGPGPYTLRVVTIADGVEYLVEEWVDPVDIPAYEFEAILTAADHGVGSDDFFIAWVFDGDSYELNNWNFDDIFLGEAPDMYMVNFFVGEDTAAQTPIEGANIHVAGNHLVTDAAGTASVELPEGSYTANVTASGYVAQVVEFTLSGADLDVDVFLMDNIVTPFNLEVTTEGLPEGEALFMWNVLYGDLEFADSFEDGNFDAWHDVILGPGVGGEAGNISHWYIDDPDGADSPDGGLVARIDWGYDIDSWLITPMISVTSSTAISFYWNSSYFWSVDPNPHAELMVKVSTDGVNWTEIWNWQDIGEWDSWVWYQTILDLEDYVGQGVHVAFHMLADDNANMHLDGVAIGPSDKTGTFALSGKPSGIDQSARYAPASAFDRAFVGYNVFLNDVMMAENHPDNEFLFTGLPGGEHTAGVQSVYTTGSSEIVTIDFEVEGPVGFDVLFVVTDVHGEPVEDALITLNGLEGFTDEAGEFLFEDLEGGTYDYMVELFCYVDAMGTIMVDSNMEELVVLGNVPGDADGNGAVNVLDAIIILNVFQGDHEGPFCFNNADVNNDGSINVLDAIGTLNIFQEQKVSPYEGLISETAHITLSSEGIRLTSDGTVTGLQFLLEGADIHDLEMKLELPSHIIGYNVVGDELRAMIISLENAPIPAGDIELLRFVDPAENLGWKDVLVGNLNALEVPVVTHTDIATGLVDVAGDIGFTAYPNPATDQLTVEFVIRDTQDVRVSLMNLHGQVIEIRSLNESGPVQLHFDTSGLVPGIYMLRLDHGKERIMERIMVK